MTFAAPAAPAAAPTRLLVLAGQSNAVGNGTQSEGLDGTRYGSSADIAFRYWIRIADAAATPHTSGGGWTTMGPVITGSTQTPYNHDTTAPIGGFGPEVVLARTLADTPGVGTVAVVKVAVGGTEMGDGGDATGKDWWQVGGNLHARLRAEIDAALADFAVRGEAVEWAGFFWMQGESDARKDGNVDRTANALAYEANLTELITDLRTAYGVPQLPVVIGRVDPTLVWGMNFAANKEIVRAAQESVAASVGAAEWVNVDDLPRVNTTDTIHFNSVGQQRLGWRMAQAWLRIQSRACADLDWQHIRPLDGRAPRAVARDGRELAELNFAATRDLWLRMVRGWAGLLNAGGTGWSGTYYFEGALRMIWPLTAWLANPERPTAPEVDGAPVDIAAFALNALRNGSDPAHPNRWPLTASATDIYDQIIVEAPMAGLAAWILQRGAAAAANPADPMLPWNGLTSAHRANINAFLAGMPNRAYVNNWNLFVALNNATRRTLADAGIAEFGGHDPAVIDNALALVDQMHRGGGWYSDDTQYSVMDDYNALVMLPYQILNYIMSADLPDSATVIPGTHGRDRQSVLRDVAAWCATQGAFFDDHGAHIEFGRSTSYKFGRLVALVLAYHLERNYNAPEGGWNYPFQIFSADAFPIGQLRRLIRLHLNHYLANETVNPDTFRLIHGQTLQSGAQTMENYLERSPASVLWAMKLFGALWMLDDDDPLWSAPELPLPAETSAFTHWFHAPGFLVHGDPATGHVELINARNSKKLVTTYQIQQYLNKYNKFAYSSRLGWATRSGTRIDHCLLVNDAYRGAAPDGDLYRPANWPDGLPGVVRSIEEFGGRRIASLIFLKDGAHVRVHRVSGSTGYRLRDGGYALGRDTSESATTQSGTAAIGAGWRYLQSTRGSVFIQALAGYDSMATLSGTGNHSRDPAWTLAYANLASAATNPTHVAILTKGSSFAQNPSALAALVTAIRFIDGGAEITFNDNTILWAPFIP